MIDFIKKFESLLNDNNVESLIRLVSIADKSIKFYIVTMPFTKLSAVKSLFLNYDNVLVYREKGEIVIEVFKLPLIKRLSFVDKIKALLW
jgi:hypothetical protein